MRELLSRAERYLLPAACLLCNSPVPPRESDALVCGVCMSRWRRVDPPYCPQCGASVEQDDPCTICTTWPPGLLAVRSAVWMDGRARDAVHALKYGGWWRVASSLAARMAALIESPAEAVYIPIPLGGRRQRRRGYNQSEAIANALAQRFGGRCMPDILRRGRETRSQTALTPAERAANVKGAFRVVGVVPARVVLVDDVFTTGATLLEAAHALHAAAPATVIRAVTFARARTALE